MDVWCRVRLLDGTGRVAAAWAEDGPGAPDVGLVDLLARLHLAARRRGWSLEVTDVAPALAALIDLTGLDLLTRPAPPPDATDPA